MSQPSTVRVLWLLARVALERRVNRFRTQFDWFDWSGGKKGASAARTGTGRKHAGRLALAVVALGYAWQAVFLSTQFVEHLVPAVELAAPDGRLTISPAGYRLLLDRFTACGPQGCPQFATEITPVLRDEVKRTFRKQGETSALSRLLEIATSRGIGGFRARDSDFPLGLLPDERLWAPAEHRTRMEPPLALMWLLLGVALFFALLGSKDQELDRADWSMEWLYTLPASARSLLLAHAFELALTNVMCWFTVLPLSFVLLYCAGLGWWAAVLAPVTTLYMGIVIASAAVPLEATLRKRLTAGRLQNVRATCVLMATVFLGGTFTLMISHGRWLVAIAEHAPAFATWTPLSLPAQLVTGEALHATIFMCILGMGLPLLGASLAERALADGLIGGASAHEGTRGPAKALGSQLPFGIIGKELRLLMRNRTFLTQTLVVPGVLFAMQIGLNPDLLGGAGGGMRSAAALAFGLGAYVLTTSAILVLAVERDALWMLMAVPGDLTMVLMHKVRLWCALALVWTCGILFAYAAVSPSLDVQGFLVHGATAIAGVIIHAFIAGGIGILATDPLESETHKRVRPEAMFVFILLASMFSLAIYSDDIWPKITQLVLSALLAAALWQKVRDRSPYFLDPTAAPPPQIEVAGGLIAALAFFVLQGVVLVIADLETEEAPRGATTLVAFAIAGVLVGLTSLYTLWQERVPNLWVAVGLRGGGAGAIPRALGLGVLGGMGTALSGLAWLWALDHVPVLAPLQDDALRFASASATDLRWLAVLAVVAAPLFEEFIFRGLVFRGLQRSYSTGKAVFASAAIFAIVHPAISALPVFVMALVAALVFERSKLLLAPILVHAIYNAVVIGVQIYRVP